MAAPNPYFQAARAFTDAYRSQVEAANAQAAATTPADQSYQYMADTTPNQLYGSESSQEFSAPNEQLNGFDPELDENVDLVKEQLLNQAKAEVEAARRRIPA